MARITCDKTGWPNVVVSFSNAYSDTDFADYLGELSSIMARGPTSLIVDTRLGQAPTAVQRQRLMRFVKANWESLSGLCGIVFVVDSLIARHALTAVSWIVAKPCPIELVASMGEAQAWVLRHGARVERQLQR